VLCSFAQQLAETALKGHAIAGLNKLVDHVIGDETTGRAAHTGEQNLQNFHEHHFVAVGIGGLEATMRNSVSNMPHCTSHFAIITTSIATN
jgi:hypothetical protein